MTEATLRPWKRIETDMFGIYAIKGKRIAEVLPRPADKGFGFASEAIANADLIVRAVNAHDALVAALTLVAYRYESGDIGDLINDMPEIEAALEAAK